MYLMGLKTKTTKTTFDHFELDDREIDKYKKKKKLLS